MDPQDSFLRVSIIDDGQGIASENMKNLFSKFFQINRPDGGSSYKGTGLSLAISKEIIHLHHGKIWVEREIDHGSKFCFTLPIV